MGFDGLAVMESTVVNGRVWDLSMVVSIHPEAGLMAPVSGHDEVGILL